MEVKVLSSIKEYQPGPQIPQSIWMTLGLLSRGTRPHDLIREGLKDVRISTFSLMLYSSNGASWWDK
ncbi:hypothetical protein [Pseudomonas sp. GM48]|uniref:hypothetical protein n=1 Tax=Pseudomonas sp. GM48 TaxID=1144330 RepID=UPI00026FE648|nr:hypothetical protein [Pseudomonas sp. GM48]EJM56209.1 hypothetical protein PMI28_03190 [Pseudomonas sp. GM48]